jgi:hypothetical protein
MSEKFGRRGVHQELHGKKIAAAQRARWANLKVEKKSGWLVLI